MRRREFLGALGSAAMPWPLTAQAQQSSKVPRVGVLAPGNPPPGDPFRQAERFEAGLRELGWQPGKNETRAKLSVRGQSTAIISQWKRVSRLHRVKRRGIVIQA